MFERALASICLFHKVLRGAGPVLAAPTYLRQYIRGDCPVPFLVTIIEFRTKHVDGMKECCARPPFVQTSFIFSGQTNSLSSSPVYFESFPSYPTIEIRNLEFRITRSLKKKRKEKKWNVYLAVVYAFANNWRIYFVACHPLDSRKLGTMAGTQRGDGLGIPNRYLYTRDSGSLWEACRENCVIFHSSRALPCPIQKLARHLGPAARQGRRGKGGDLERSGTERGGWGYSREDVCLAAPDKIASLLIKLCSWMSLLNSVVNTHHTPHSARRVDITAYYPSCPRQIPLIR